MQDQSDLDEAARILICEEEASLAKDLAQTLESLGYEVVNPVSSAEQAVQRAVESRPDLIIVDSKIRGKADSVEVAEQILAQMDVPIVYLTDHADGDIFKRANRTENYGFLTKPAATMELVRTIEAALYQHAADRRLSESEARRAKAEALAGLHSWEWEIKTGQLTWSAESYYAFGLKPDDREIYMDTLIDLIHPDDKDVVRSALNNALSGLHPYDLEFRILKPNGEERVLHSRAEIQRDSQGRPLRMQGMALDITDRKQAEAQLRESELWMRSVFNALEESVVIATMDRVIKDLNPATERIFGYKKDELVGRNTSILHVDSEHYSQFGRYVLEAFDRGETPELEFELKRKNGEIFPSNHTVSLLKDRHGEPIGVVSVFRDITNLKKAQDALRKSEERFRLVYESDMLGMGFCNMDGEILDANDAYLNIIQRSRDDLLNNRINWKEITPPEHLPADFNAIEELLAYGRCKPYEKEYLLADGSRVPVIIGGALLPGSPTTVIAFALDVTDRKHAEDQTRASLEEKEVLLREIHHRVKNNLAVISSLLNMQSRVVANEGLQTIYDAAQSRIRSMALAHEMLYRAENLSAIDAREYVKNLVNHLRAAVHLPTPVIDLNLDIDKVSFDLDTMIPLGLILNELVSNSMKHSFVNRTKGEIKVSLQPLNDHEFKLTVADNGIGMSKEIDSVDRKSLGLHLVKMFAKQLRGEIEITREQGTQVHLKFPVKMS